MPCLEEIEQNTANWLMARRGLVTSSHMGDVVAKTMNPKVESKYRYNYKWEVISEILSPHATEHFVTKPMQWGLDTQPHAGARYEIENNLFLDAGGFWIHDRIPRFAASPDYLVGDEGLVEIKCPETRTHLEYLKTGEINEKYKWQMWAQLACTGRKWVDFVSFDPRVTDYALQYRCDRIERDDKMIRAAETEVLQFLKEIDQIIEQLKTKGHNNGVQHQQRILAG